MMLTHRGIVTGLALCLCVICPNIKSARADVAGVALGGVAASKLIGQFEEAGNRFLQNGANQGDALMSKFGNEVNVATRNLDIALGDERDKTFDQLNPVQQQLFVELNKMIATANGASNQAAKMAEIANLDLINFTNRLPFTEKVRFYLSSISGLTQPYSDGATPYDFRLRGIGFAFPPSDQKYDVKVFFGDQQLPSNAIRTETATDIVVEVPHDVMEKYFKDDSVVQVPMRIESTITWDDPFLLVFKKSKTSVFTIPFKAVLLPRYPGTVQGYQPIQMETLDPTIHTTSVTNHTQGCHSDNPCNWSKEIKLANDEVAVGVRYTCVGQCGWDYRLRAKSDGPGHEYDPDFDILQDGHKVIVYRHNDGEHATDVTYYVDYRKLTKIYNQAPIGPLKLQFNKPTTIDLDARNSGCAYQLTGELVTKQKPYLDNGMTQSVDGALSKLSIAKVGGHCVLNLALNFP